MPNAGSSIIERLLVCKTERLRHMSSHREAPEISKDPVADNTDVYAFVSPDNPSTVTLIANFIPLEWPPGGPNFYEFGDDVLYEINIDNDGDGVADIAYQFQFQTTLQNPDTFLYNTGPISSLTDPNWNKRQLYSLSRVKNGRTTVLGDDLASPPCNIGPSSPRTMTLSHRKRSTFCPVVKRYLPGSGPRGSMSIWVRYSTFSTCDPSKIFTSIRWLPRPASTAPIGSTSIPWRSSCPRAC